MTDETNRTGVPAVGSVMALPIYIPIRIDGASVSTDGSERFYISVMGLDGQQVATARVRMSAEVVRVMPKNKVEREAVTWQLIGEALRRDVLPALRSASEDQAMTLDPEPIVLLREAPLMPHPPVPWPFEPRPDEDEL